MYHIADGVSNVVLLCWSIGMEPRSGRVFVARTQRWNYTQTGLSNTVNVLDDSEQNVTHWEPDYSKHTRVTSRSDCDATVAAVAEGSGWYNSIDTD